MIYFDNAATGGFKPYSVQEVVCSVIKYMCVNPTRSGHKMSAAAGETVYRTRRLFKEVFNCCGEERVIFTKNCTEALNTAIFGTLNEGDHVVTTCMEHNSVLRPLHALKEVGKISITIVEPKKAAFIPQNTHISYETIREHITKKTRLVITNHVSNVTGAEADINDIGNGLKSDFPNVIYVVDGAQSGGHIDIDMQRDCVDILCLAGHKGINGIMGSGVLIFNNCDIRPLTLGGTGSDSFNLNQPDYYPDCLESGTLNFPAIASLYEGLIHTKNTLTFNSVQLTKMTDTLISSLNIKGVNVYSIPNRCGIVALSVNDIPSQECASILSDKYGIAVRGGYHCAPLMHKFLKTEQNGLIRVSLSANNTYKEMAQFVSAITKIATET